VIASGAVIEYARHATRSISLAAVSGEGSQFTDFVCTSDYAPLPWRAAQVAEPEYKGTGAQDRAEGLAMTDLQWFALAFL